MIIACTKPSGDPSQKANHHSFFQSLEELYYNSIALPRTNSVPNLSRTAIILEADMLIDDLNSINNIPSEKISYCLIKEFKKEEMVTRNNSSPHNNSLLKFPKGEATEDNLSDHKVKSNVSNNSMRCNYLLKSDVYKSSSRSNFYYSHQEESPMLNYYGSVPNLNKRPSTNNDYMLFVKKPKRDSEIDFNTANYFQKNPANKKEIMISRYTEDDELVEYINSPSIVPEEEEEAVTVEMPANLKNSNNYNNSNSSDSTLLFKQLPRGFIDKPQQQKQKQNQKQPEFNSQIKSIEMTQKTQPFNQQPSYQQEMDLSPIQQFNHLQQQPQPLPQPLPQPQMDKLQGVEQMNQPPINNSNLMNPYMLNNYMYANFIANQNMIFQMVGGNNGMNQYYQLPINNFPSLYQNYPLMNGMNYPMMNNNLNINPQMHPIQPPIQKIKISPQQQPLPLQIPINPPQSQPQMNPINNIPQYNPNVNLQQKLQYNNSSSTNTNNINGTIMNNSNSNNNNNNNKRHQKPTTSNYSNYSDESLAQLAPFLIKEQTGCRYIQDKSNSDPHFANDILFPHLKEEIFELICDQFGNYLFQVLLDVLNPENIESLLKHITNFFYQICISPHGTRVVQKLIDKIPNNLTFLQLFKQMLFNQLGDTCKDPYGNHIIQKYLSVVGYPHNQFVYDYIYANFIDISNSKHGCCVIQKGISEGNAEQREHLLDIINKNLFEIITDQFGNYTIQYIFSSQNNFNINAILATVLDNIVYLCKQKYSSNVLEKCFENSSKEIQKMLIRELAKDDSVICELISDSYGNYVMQKALIVNRDENYARILNVIASNIGKIKKQSFGTKLIAKLLVTHKELGNIITNYKKDKEQNSNSYQSTRNINSNMANYNSNNNEDSNNGYYMPDNGSSNNNNTNFNYNQGKSYNNNYSSYNHNYYKKKPKDKGIGYKH